MSIHRVHTSYGSSVMSRKQINAPGWRYAPLLGDNGGGGDKSVDNSQHRHEVNLSVSPGCTVFSISVSVHALTVKQRLALFRPLICDVANLSPRRLQSAHTTTIHTSNVRLDGKTLFLSPDAKKSIFTRNCRVQAAPCAAC